MDIINLFALLLLLWGVFCLFMCAFALYLFIFHLDWVRERLARFVGNDEQLRHEYERRWMVLRQELEQLRSERQQHATQVNHLGRQYAQDRQKQDAVVNELIGFIDQSNSALDFALGKLPKIQEADQYFASMSKKVREELTFTLSPIFAQGTAQLTAQQIAAVCKLHEIEQRFTLYLKTVRLEQVVLPIGVNAELGLVYQLQTIFRQWDEKIDDPACQVLSDALKSKAATRLLNESKVIGDVFNLTSLMKLFLASREEKARLASNSQQKAKVVGLYEDDSSLATAVADVLKSLEEVYVNPNGSGNKRNGKGETYVS